MEREKKKKLTLGLEFSFSISSFVFLLLGLAVEPRPLLLSSSCIRRKKASSLKRISEISTRRSSPQSFRVRPTNLLRESCRKEGEGLKPLIFAIEKGVGLLPNLKDSSQLLVKESNKHFALVVLLGERQNHAAHRRQQLEGANLIHVLLTEEGTVNSHERTLH